MSRWRQLLARARGDWNVAAKAFPDAARRASGEVLRFAGMLGVMSLGFLGLFVLHQAFLWASVRPAVAFERAKVVIYALEVGWDATARVVNAELQLVDALIPLWNAGAHYVVEPAIYVALDVLSLIFTRAPYAGLISEEDVPYAGFVCPSDPSTAAPAWCGAFEHYEASLKDADTSGGMGGMGGFASESIVLGAATARRLQEATGEAIIPTLDVGALVPGLVGLSSAGITLIGSLADVAMDMIYMLLSEVAPGLFDAAFMVSKALVNAALAVVRSGMLTTILGFGIDLMLILVLEWMMPLLFAGIDALMCAIDLMFPEGWDAQLQCIDEHCFESESDAVADLIVFTSVPVVWERFRSVLAATINSNTGRKYGLSNLPGLDWVDTPAATLPGVACAECFVCKVPELRLVSLLIMTIVGCTKPTNLQRFTGGAEDQCRTGGAWYAEQACGPADGSMEFLSDEQWADAFPAHRRHDETVVEYFAGVFAKRSRQLGGAGSVDGQAAGAIADAWFLREPSGDGRDEAAKFYRLACNEARAQRKAAGVPLVDPQDGLSRFWTGPAFVEHSSGSMAHETTRFLYDACAIARAPQPHRPPRTLPSPMAGAKRTSSTSATAP